MSRTPIEDFLRPEGDAVSVGGNVEKVDRRPDFVIVNVRNTDNGGGASEALPVPSHLPQDAVQVGLALEHVKFFLCTAGVVNGPAVKHLARRAFEVIHPNSSIRIVFPFRIAHIGDRAPVRRPKEKQPTGWDRAQRLRFVIPRVENLGLALGTGE